MRPVRFKSLFTVILCTDGISIVVDEHLVFPAKINVRAGLISCAQANNCSTDHPEAESNHHGYVQSSNPGISRCSRLTAHVHAFQFQQVSDTRHKTQTKMSAAYLEAVEQWHQAEAVKLVCSS
jgi:hypothetical protein